MKLISILYVAAMLAVLAGAAHGQQQSPGLSNGAALSLSASRMVFSETIARDDRTIVGPSISFFWLANLGPGFDGNFTVLPPTGFHRLTGGVADLGMVFNVRRGGTALLLRGGFSATGAANSTGGYMAGAGGYGGAGLLMAAGGSLGLRADVTGRSYYGGNAPDVLSVSVGAVLLPRQR